MSATHKCVINGCEKWIRRSKLMCPLHWSCVPQLLKDGIYDAYYQARASEEARAAHLDLCAAAKRAVEAAR